MSSTHHPRLVFWREGLYTSVELGEPHAALGTTASDEVGEEELVDEE